MLELNKLKVGDHSVGWIGWESEWLGICRKMGLLPENGHFWQFLSCFTKVVLTRGKTVSSKVHFFQSLFPQMVI